MHKILYNMIYLINNNIMYTVYLYVQNNRNKQNKDTIWLILDYYDNNDEYA